MKKETNLLKYAEIPSSSNLSAYPTIVDIMEIIAEQEEAEVETFSPIQRTIIGEMVRPGSYIVIRGENEGDTELIPTGKRIFTTYRGESSFHPICKASLYRNYTEYGQLLSDLQISELKVLLDSHHIIKDLIENPLYHPQLANPFYLHLHYEGLAQHYGIHTRLLDFTNDKWTAAFFATTRWEQDHYCPILSTNSVNAYGVLYYNEQQNTYNPVIRPIGLHYFNRPGAQSGFALYMDKNADLNKDASIKRIFFRHDSYASSIVYSMNQKGDKLFPNDSLVYKVKEIINSKVFSNSALAICKQSYYANLSDDEFQRLLKKYDISSQSASIVSFSEDEVKQEWQNWLNGGKQKYLQSLLIIPLIHL